MPGPHYSGAADETEEGRSRVERIERFAVKSVPAELWLCAGHQGENARLKKLNAEAELDKSVLKEFGPRSSNPNLSAWIGSTAVRFASWNGLRCRRVPHT